MTYKAIQQIIYRPGYAYDPAHANQQRDITIHLNETQHARASQLDMQIVIEIGLYELLIIVKTEHYEVAGAASLDVGGHRFW